MSFVELRQMCRADVASGPTYLARFVLECGDISGGIRELLDCARCVAPTSPRQMCRVPGAAPNRVFGSEQ